MTVIGVRIIDLYLPTTQSLKDKRRIIKSMTQRVRSRFNISISELDYQDHWGKARLGMAIITTEQAYAQKVLEAASRIIEQYSEAEIYQLSTEIL